MNSVAAFSLASVLLLSACATGGPPASPPAGPPSPFDGNWHGTAFSPDRGCDNIYVDGAVANGAFLGNVRQVGRKIGEIWGQLDDNGMIQGVLRSSGVSVGASTLKFTANKAEGTWSNVRCSGSLSLQKS